MSNRLNYVVGISKTYDVTALYTNQYKKGKT
ncbi:MAG: hypothetical protein Ct9H300mP18_10410 [Candidatus Neomarinimicrobiota bacterium]|nr:MAG: hypothetical protein Ct9H300mP18_10410 [Candidatus Neomarinimicrobiota bacterium]